MEISDSLGFIIVAEGKEHEWFEGEFSQIWVDDDKESNL